MKKISLDVIVSRLEKEKNCVFLESAKQDEQNYLSYIFRSPEKIISTKTVNEVLHCFKALDNALECGYYVAGFISYEAGEAFEERLKSKDLYEFPLLWFGLYRKPLIYDHRKGNFVSHSKSDASFVKSLHKFNQERKPYHLDAIKPNVVLGSYIKAIARIKRLIASGLTYQVNYTFKLKFSHCGSLTSLYCNLRDSQEVSYSAFINMQDTSVLSFSPELFFKRIGKNIITRPMKGTISRGKSLNEDTLRVATLQGCAKNRSENVMIVDLLRNDLGRISSTGSVHVPELFKVEQYSTLFQMTSDVHSRLRKNISSFDILNTIFPSGSVTGAPKVRTMQIIKTLEKEPRKVYTGSIGFFSPKGDATFNVAIRTLLIDKKNKRGEMGVGSGIVYDSDARSEYEECLLKAHFLTKVKPKFELIESMLWEPPDGYFLLELHLDRLKDSARYFNFSFDRKKINKELRSLEHTLLRAPYKVRLLLAKNGYISLEATLLSPQRNEKLKVSFSLKQAHSKDVYLFHKTTQRELYSQEWLRCREKGFYDVLFENEKSQVTEGAISNIIIREKDAYYTPPLKCGLLDGVYRRHLLNENKFGIKERILSRKDLERADEIYLINSVRKMVRVELETKSH